MPMLCTSRMKPNQANTGIGFVNRAVGFNAQIGFQPARTRGQACCSIIACACINLVEFDHFYCPLVWRAK